MASINSFIIRHPVLTYFVLGFVISWGGVLLIIGGPGSIPGSREQVDQLVPFAMLAWLAGPGLAGVFLTVFVDGRAGLAALRSRMFRWRVGAAWYAVALLTAPLLYMMVLLTLALYSPDFLPGILTTSEKTSLLLFGIAWGLIGGGFLEELGWTGFAVPKLRSRYGVFVTALIVGVLWGALHLIVIFWMADGTFGSLSLALFLPVRAVDLLVGGLVAYRVLMTWVYEHTNDSLLLAMLMHASLTATMIITGPVGLSGVPFLAHCVVLSVATWLIVGVVAWANRGHLSRQNKPSVSLGGFHLTPH